MCAVERGLERIIRLLLEHSADPNVHNQSIGLTATYFAVSADNDAVLRLFLARKDVDRNMECESSRMGFLLYAASVGSVTVLKTLLDNPAVDVHSKDNHYRNALLVAMHHEKEEAAKVLLADGWICLNEGDIENGRPLAYAASKGWTDIVDLLLESGADIEHPDDSGQTALFHATGATSNMLLERARLLG
ncbi:ankyrin repeat-containing domain protein [Aspergillus pseudodeflectus]|uniref:Ankyrin repeat-containing domain protein n=1 Tax=Aspergillus pseudodeflectus TaxID=176178 RepID=A0ABR4L5D6_9EURO